MTTETLSANLKACFGFDFKSVNEHGAIWLGTQDNGDEFYCRMGQYDIVVCITDAHGNSIWVEVDNEDMSTSGLEASILCKQFYRILKYAVKHGGKLVKRPLDSHLNGRKVNMIWKTKKES